MSFSLTVKSEIINIFKSRHCSISELCSILNYCGSIDDAYLTIQAENKLSVDRFLMLFNNIFGINLDICRAYPKTYKIVLKDKNLIKSIFNTIEQQSNDVKACNPIIVNNVCCKRAYIRGAFLCNGYISNPQKNYHIEFINSSYEQAKNLKNIINHFDVDSKIIEKKDNFIVYIKESEQIVELLNIIEAHKALIDFENIRIIKDVRNNINRIVNCETANLSKVVSTGVKQKQDIEYIDQKIGIYSLPPQLIEIAKLRLENPDISLQELSEIISIKISKSGINHRLKKLNNIAENLRRN